MVYQAVCVVGNYFRDCVGVLDRILVGIEVAPLSLSRRIFEG
jgi:hypothetical protein